jgi:hypothetical protein
LHGNPHPLKLALLTKWAGHVEGLVRPEGAAATVGELAKVAAPAGHTEGLGGACRIVRLGCTAGDADAARHGRGARNEKGLQN